MKYVIAVIQPDKLEDVLEALEEENVHLVTASDVMGRGRQKGMAEIYRSHVEPGNLLRKVKLEIAVNDDFVAQTIAASSRSLARAASATARSSCSILERCVRIRTGETGSVAIG